MADKYIKQSDGYFQEVEGTTSSAGVADAGEIVALNASGKVDSTMIPAGVSAGDIVTQEQTLALSPSGSITVDLVVTSNGDVVTL